MPSGTSALTHAECLVIHDRLRRRFLTAAAKAKYGITDVFLGVARRSRRVDRRRLLSVCFQVEKKYKRVPQRLTPIPKDVTLRIPRSGQTVALTFRTDVVNVPRIVPSGRIADTPLVASSDEATCGLVITWNYVTSQGTTAMWAVLTVGHSCDDPSSMGGVAIVSVRPRFGSPYTGLLKAMTEADGLDVALVLVSPHDLRQDGVDVTFLQHLMSLDDMTGDHRRKGQTLNASLGDVSIQAETPPQPRELGSLGVKKNVVKVKSQTADAFAPGSSGAAWLLKNNDGTHAVACIQLATEKNDHSVGYGQALSPLVIQWAMQAASDASRPFAMQAGSFRFVRAF